MPVNIPGNWTMFQSLSIEASWLCVTTPPISTDPDDSAPVIWRIV